MKNQRKVGTRDLGLATLGCAMLVLAGCQAPPTAADFQPLVGGTFENVGGIIEEPGVLHIVGGEQFTTPFSVDCRTLSATSDGWPAALAAGAHRVVITLPGEPRYYGGVLALCRVHKSAYGPDSRAYSLGIPESAIGEAQNGLVASMARQVMVNRVQPINLGAALGGIAVQGLLAQQGLAAQPDASSVAQPSVITEDFVWMLWITDRPEVMGVSFQPTVPPRVAKAPVRAPERQAPALVKAATYTVLSVVNLRAGPSVSTAVLSKLSPGDAVVATGDQSGGFWSVTTVAGQSGWVSAKSLKAN
jgi:hypothetical protein